MADFSTTVVTQVTQAVVLSTTQQVVQVNSAIPGSYLSAPRLGFGIYSVKDPAYGAVGDGTTNDSVAVQAAATAGANATVYFPPGTYCVADIAPSSGSTWVLAAGATVQSVMGATEPVIDGGTLTGFRLVGEGTIDGTGSSGAEAVVRLASLTDGVIRGVTIQNGARRGLYIRGGSNVLVDSVGVFDCGWHGIQVEDTNDCTVRDASVARCARHGVVFTPVAANILRALITGCRVIDCAQGSLFWGLYFNSGDTYIVTRSKMESCVVDGTLYGGIFPGGDFNDVVNCSARNCSGWRGLWVHDSRGIGVVGGFYNENGRDGILVSKALEVRIVGVQCHLNARDGILVQYDATATGRYQGANANKDILVEGCVCTNNGQESAGTYDGIVVDSTTGTLANVQVIGSRCLDTQTIKTQRRAISSSGSGSGVVVVGNSGAGNLNANSIVVSPTAAMIGNTPATNDRTQDPIGNNVGDADATLTVGVSAPVQRWASTLTQNRTVTLSTTNAVNGDHFRIVRSGLGNFTLNVGGLKTIPALTAAFVDVSYDGSAWVLIGYGTL